jgi:hypothetical protein
MVMETLRVRTLEEASSLIDLALVESDFAALGSSLSGDALALGRKISSAIADRKSVRTGWIRETVTLNGMETWDVCVSNLAVFHCSVSTS